MKLPRHTTKIPIPKGYGVSKPGRMQVTYPLLRLDRAREARKVGSFTNSHEIFWFLEVIARGIRA